MIWMDVDVALASVPVNSMPLIDSGDFKTIEDAVVYNQAGLALFWNFTTTAGVTTVTAVTPTTGDDHDWTDFTTSGMYGIEIPASGGDVSNDTEGFGHFTGVATGILPWAGPVIGFRAATLNNTFIDDASSILTSADVGLLYESVITTSTTETELIMATAFAVDDSWIGCECSLEDKSTGEFYSGNIWISDAIQATETLDLNTAFPVLIEDGVDVLRIYARQHASYAAVGINTSSSTNTTNILDKLLAYFQLALRKDAAIATDRSTELSEINADESSGAGGYVSTTDSTQSIRDELVVVDGNVDTINTNVSTVSTNVDSILVDTAEIGTATDTDISTDIANVQTAADAVKAKTDSLTFTKANEVDSNIQSVDDVTIGESGTGDQNFGEV